MANHGPARWSGSQTGKRSVQARAPRTGSKQGSVAEQPAVPDTEATEPDATDAAKVLAGEHNIDLATVTGTGADGRITKDDVAALIPAEPEQEPEPEQPELPEAG